MKKLFFILMLLMPTITSTMEPDAEGSGPQIQPNQLVSPAQLKAAVNELRTFREKYIKATKNHGNAIISSEASIALCIGIPLAFTAFFQLISILQMIIILQQGVEVVID